MNFFDSSISKKNFIFILGCERSGSTWLSNILFAHESVHFTMEPLAKQLEIFNDFPHRNHYMDSLQPDLEQYFLNKILLLHRMQFPFFYKPGNSPALYQLDRFLLASAIKFSKLFKLKLPLKFVRFKDLSLSMHRPNSGRIFSQKKFDDSSRILIKELRLNFKTLFLTKVFPQAKYIVVIRHPAGQLHSIMERMKKGSLAEITEALTSFPNDCKDENFSQYRHMLDQWDTLNLERKLAIWWLINYQTLINSLKRSGCEFTIVYHEEISKDPGSHINKIFNFLDIDQSEHVLEYVEASSTSAMGKEFDTLDTYRNSKSYFRDRINQAPESLIAAIQETLMAIEIIPELECYIDAKEYCDLEKKCLGH